MLAALLLVADLAGSLGVADRTELRVRAPGTAPAAASFDVETAPELRLSLASPRLRYTLAYTPRVTIWDAGSSAPAATLLQSGQARVEWLTRRAQLSLDETASYGGASFASSPLVLGPEGQPPRVEVIPSPRVLQLVSTTTTLASRLSLRRWTVDTSVGYRLAGGATAEARALLPREAGPFGEATADYAILRADHAFTRLSASESAFSSGPESVLVEVDGGFRHLWSRATEMRLAIGVAEARARTSALASSTFETHPVVEAVFERRQAARGYLDVALGVRLSPVVNRLDGTLDQRVQGTLAASHRSGRLTTRVLASAAQSVPASDVNAVSLFAGELGVAYGASRAVTFDAGVRGAWQLLQATRVPFLQGTVFAGVTLRAPTTRF